MDTHTKKWQAETARIILALSIRMDFSSEVLVDAFFLIFVVIQPTENLPTPHISPVPGGGIQFEWQKGYRELELEILPNRSIEFLVVTEGDMTEGHLRFVDSDEIDVTEINRLCAWVAGDEEPAQ